MKKLINVTLTTILAFGMLGCSSSKPEAVTTVENFLTAITEGSLENSANYLSSDLSDAWVSSYDYFSSYAESYTLTDETIAAEDEMVSYSLKASCTKFTLGDYTKESDTSYTVNATLEYVDTANADLEEYESEIIDQYQLTDEMTEGLEDEEIANLYLKNVALYNTELFKYVIENGPTTTSEMTFTVEKEDDAWVITNLSTVADETTDSTETAEPTASADSAN